MIFKLSYFTVSPSQELLDLAKGSDLLDIAEHYVLPNVKRSMLKHEIKNILIQFLWMRKFLIPRLISILVTQTDLQLRGLEIKRQLELEKLKLEHKEKRRVEMAEREESLRIGPLEQEERMHRER